MRPATFGILLSVSLVVGCTQDQAAATPPRFDEAAARAALEPRLTAIAQIFQKKDAGAIATMFTDDAVWVLPDASTFKGREEIQKGAAGFFTSFDSTVGTSESFDRVIPVSDSEVVTFATGKYTLFLKGKKTGEAHVNPFADDWKKGADGVWRIAYEVNAEGTGAPPAAPPAAPAATKKP